MSYNLAGKVVLITGSSSGIGQGTAVAFAKEGSFVTITGRNVEGLKETKRLCMEAGLPEDKILFVVGDLREGSVRNEVVQGTLRRFGKIDVLVNNAGMMRPGTLEASSVEDFDLIFEINVKVVFLLTQSVMPHLIRTKGNVVNVSSVAATKACRGILSYCMSKAALDQFTRCVALEVAPKGVRVNCVNPGIVPTNVFRDAGLPREKLEQLLEGNALLHAMQRLGTVDEVAKGILHLASDNASFTTGHCLLIDGGIMVNIESASARSAAE